MNCSIVILLYCSQSGLIEFCCSLYSLNCSNHCKELKDRSVEQYDNGAI